MRALALVHFDVITLFTSLFVCAATVQMAPRHLNFYFKINYFIVCFSLIFCYLTKEYTEMCEQQ